MLLQFHGGRKNTGFGGCTKEVVCPYETTIFRDRCFQSSSKCCPARHSCRTLASARAPLRPTCAKLGKAQPEQSSERKGIILRQMVVVVVIIVMIIMIIVIVIILSSNSNSNLRGSEKDNWGQH